MAKKVLDQKAKEKRQKIIAAVLAVAFVAVAAFQFPRMMKMMHPKPPEGPTVIPTASAPPPNSPLPASLGGTGVAQPAVATSPSTGVPAASAGQLVTFDRFASKNPFVQQVDTCGASGCPSGGSGGTTAASSGSKGTSGSGGSTVKTVTPPPAPKPSSPPPAGSGRADPGRHLRQRHAGDRRPGSRLPGRVPDVRPPLADEEEREDRRRGRLALGRLADRHADARQDADAPEHRGRDALRADPRLGLVAARSGQALLEDELEPRLGILVGDRLLDA